MSTTTRRFTATRRRVAAILAGRVREDDGGQHTEEGALIATLAALGVAAATQMDAVGQAVTSMWSAAIGG